MCNCCNNIPKDGVVFTETDGDDKVLIFKQDVIYVRAPPKADRSQVVVKHGQGTYKFIVKGNFEETLKKLNIKNVEEP